MFGVLNANRKIARNVQSINRRQQRDSMNAYCEASKLRRAEIELRMAEINAAKKASA